MYQILDKITKGQGTQHDIEVMEALSRTMMSSALCGLGQAAPNPVMTTLRFYRDEYDAHINEGKCPTGVCKF
jgi:NADH-quinone oxidoreductase subunit F